MSEVLTRVELRYEQDVVYARQRARLLAELLGFDRGDQTRLSTAVSEIARNAYQYGGGGEVAFGVEGLAKAQLFAITIRDSGPGIQNLEAILEGTYTSSTGMGLGLLGARRLVDRCHVETRPGQGTTVSLGMTLPRTAPAVTPEVLRQIAEALVTTQAESPLEETRRQNRELLSALDLLRQRDEELTRVNRELTDTNTGMIALYSDLEAQAGQLREAQKILRARNEELSAFTYTVSHDLNAPLRGIAGYAAELDRKHRTGLSERALFCITQVLAATHNLDQLIEDLLRYSRLDADMPAVTEVNLRGLVDTILQDRSLVIAELGAEVTLDIPLATLQTRERALSQVLANLIDNALKYSREANPPRLGIRAEALETCWRIQICDNGIGFDMKYHDRIFGLFNRLVRSDEYEGTGAGLAIAKKLLDQQGGRIWAEAAPGQGATFFVEVSRPGDRE
jgi:signal transduction histidine kinase